MAGGAKGKSTDEAAKPGDKAENDPAGDSRRGDKEKAGGADKASDEEGGAGTEARDAEAEPDGTGPPDVAPRRAGLTSAATGETSPPSDARLDRARQLLQEAIRRSQAKGPAPEPGGLKPFPGMKVDKYFGTKLPPVCASLGCYVTDDGKRFYCVNPACQKHKKRETKHTRRGNPAKAHFVYFRCPRCESRSLEMHVLSNRYVCRACKYSWQR